MRGRLGGPDHARDRASVPHSILRPIHFRAGSVNQSGAKDGGLKLQGRARVRSSAFSFRSKFAGLIGFRIQEMALAAIGVALLTARGGA